MEKISEKYLQVLEEISGWVTVSEWAIRFGERFPDLLEKANREAANQKNETTGLREIAARISSNISRGAFAERIEIDESERPRRVRYLGSLETSEHIEREIEEDTEPLTRSQLVRAQEASLAVREKYRLEEMESIAASLNSLFRLDFEVDHAKAILNKEDPGLHHPDNLQIILKSHNRTKSSKNWTRFSFEEQVEYVRAVVVVQRIVSLKMGVDLDDGVIDSLMSRLKLVF